MSAYTFVFGSPVCPGAFHCQGTVEPNQTNGYVFAQEVLVLSNLTTLISCKSANLNSTVAEQTLENKSLPDGQVLRNIGLLL